ncbi:Serine arginine-rich splicing factor 2, partial [Xenoophorus captivus]
WAAARLKPGEKHLKPFNVSYFITKQVQSENSERLEVVFSKVFPNEIYWLPCLLTSPETLRRVFEKYGRVGDVYIPRDRYTKESRGFAFVRFLDKRDAEDAMDAMDGALLDGRELRVQMARYGRPPDSMYSRRGAPPRRYGGYGRRSRR